MSDPLCERCGRAEAEHPSADAAEPGRIVFGWHAFVPRRAIMWSGNLDDTREAYQLVCGQYVRVATLVRDCTAAGRVLWHVLRCSCGLRHPVEIVIKPKDGMPAEWPLEAADEVLRQQGALYEVR